MLASLPVRKDVGRLKSRKCAFASDSAPATVMVGDENPKGTLAETWPNGNGVSEARLRSLRKSWRRLLYRALDERIPQLSPIGLVRDEGLEGHDIRGPRRRYWKPVILAEEKRLRQYPAPDQEILVGARVYSAVLPNSRTYLHQRSCLAEGFPSQAAWHDAGVGEHATADNEVQRRMELEQE
jgi:hypothetical protein